jgi:putative membrane protein
MLLFWGVIVGIGVLIYRALSNPPNRTNLPTPPPARTPEQLLAERFARGEIDEDEYHRRLTPLREAASRPPTHPGAPAPPP